MVELCALDDIPDLSVYGIGSANNGRGSDGQEFTLSGSTTAGSYITISKESVEYQKYFGDVPTFTSGSVSVNGDDAIELFLNGGIVDTFGENNVDGSGQPWEYMDGWAYRKAGSSPTGGSFEIGDWSLSGANAVDGCASNGNCASSFPFNSYTAVSGTSSPTLKPTNPPTSGVSFVTCPFLMNFATLHSNFSRCGTIINMCSPPKVQSSLVNVWCKPGSSIGAPV